MEKLNLSMNRLTKIRKNTFTGLTSLNELALDYNQIDDIENGALTLPNLKLLSLRINHLQVFSDLSNPSHWNNLKELNICCNPWDAVDLNTFSKYEHLKKWDISYNFNCDAIHVTPEDISTSRSKIEHLDLSNSKIKSGIIFAKLNIFPNLKELKLNDNSLATMDFDTIKRGELSKISLISLNRNNFEENWLEQATKNTSWIIDRQYGLVILRKTDWFLFNVVKK